MAPVDDASNLSIAIITLNEEKRIKQCLQSLPRGSEVCVLDSGSTDGTRSLAESLGARVETRKFTNYAEQKNAAIAMTKRPWVLSLDADEVLDLTLRDAVRDVCGQTNVAEAGFKVRRKLIFMGRQLRFGKSSDEPLRLFRRDLGRFDSEIHERVVLKSGSVGVLPGELLHYSYDDLTDYFGRFNDYTTRVAVNHKRLGRPMPYLPLHLLRPWSEFVSRYVFRLGILDGYPGYTYALLSSLYTYVKYAKLKELKQPSKAVS